MNIIITGGTSGLGKSTVELLASNSDNTVYFTYRSKKEVADKLEKTYPNVRAIHCDFCEDDSVNTFVEAIHGFDPDVLINNAYTGTTLGNYFYRTKIEEFEYSFKSNVIPLIKISQEVIKEFRKKKSGKLITVLSSALVGAPPSGFSVYSSTKAYIKQLAISWSKEYISLGITSNTVSPDFMLTDLTKNLGDFVIKQQEESNVLKRLLEPSEVARVIYDLVYAPQYVNGVDIPINLGINL